ncbi:IS200/IS605 family element transposase accessory protein TnpB [Mycolicibacterium novocastrense]|uniref:IS200/IS605 family element transposase accessory protein TnpB n=1 Tax=Mycolicibacterium novocastrense TaxID=59813 RepID=A0AAW5SU88_MYCNV|nr:MULTISPECIES: IS607 family element RNA-guided endonuclease TnpB [Mycolicibacterium]MCV7026632.1 IS200/IS605 family element transposase accessory protein TnpB [Mycolicibacterium novocastrense]MDX1887504.1 IS607 family element RNA-guided endonuclease TnpB [Mycolicibacterium sp. 120270]GAT07615.1 Rv0922-like protein [Mycolicibacterium novocastrense]
MARFEVPEGWTAQAYRFALDPTPTQLRALASHAGAARFAHNHMLALVKATMDQRAAERSYGVPEAELTPVVGWSLPALRKVWNQRKAWCAPWWAQNSKEAYNTGLDGLARGLEAWSKSRKGQRNGRAVGFPRFKSARADKSVRFTTGTIRIEADRRHVTLPRLGAIRTHESTRKLARRIEAGSARILSATVRQDSAGRWHCALQVIVETKTRPADARRSPHRVVGVDVGVKADSLLVVATPDGIEVDRIPAPKSLTAAQAQLRALQRRAARQLGPYDPAAKVRQSPSKRWRKTQARIGRTHAHAAAVRRDVLHKATTVLAQQHDVVVVETLNAAGMRTAGGARKRGLNRALADAALAEVRRMLGYKTRWYGSHLEEADRHFPSSKTCTGCGRRKPNLTLADRVFDCEHCGKRIDRDLGAAINLARLGEPTMGDQSPAGSGPVVGRGATHETEPAPAGDAAGDEASTPHHHPVDQTGTASPQGEAA